MKKNLVIALILTLGSATIYGDDLCKPYGQLCIVKNGVARNVDKIAGRITYDDGVEQCEQKMIIKSNSRLVDTIDYVYFNRKTNQRSMAHAKLSVSYSNNYSDLENIFNKLENKFNGH